MEKEKPHALEMGKEKAQEAQKEDEKKGRGTLMRAEQRREKPPREREPLKINIIHGRIGPEKPVPIMKERPCGEMAMPLGDGYAVPMSEPLRK